MVSLNKRFGHFSPGQVRSSTGTETSNYNFTDQELDPESGLYNYNARLYDPVIGRFISADTIVQAPSDPQSLNRYMYCRGNPLVYVDPSGHSSFFSNVFRALDPLTYATRRIAEHYISNIGNDDLRSFVQGMANGFFGSISPQIAAEEGGLTGALAWGTGGILSYSHEGGWGASVGGSYYCFFGATSWQSRGPESGWHQTFGIGYQKGNFIAGFAYTYHFSADYGSPSIYIGAAGKRWSAGVNYDLGTGHFSSWNYVNAGAIFLDAMDTYYANTQDRSWDNVYACSNCNALSLGERIGAQVNWQIDHSGLKQALFSPANPVNWEKVLLWWGFVMWLNDDYKFSEPWNHSFFKEHK